MSVNQNDSTELFERAKQIIPGGVNSPVRACTNVGCNPLFIEYGDGGTITTVDGDVFIDFVNSWGPIILGHAHREVTYAAITAILNGSSYGAPCPAEVELAQMIVDAYPSIDMVRMVNSGTEATMSALRVARGVTGKNKFIKFIGCYHGHADPFLAAAGSGVATLSIPGTPGVPASTTANTLLAEYNDLESVEQIFLANKNDIAAVIVEPVAGNMGLILPVYGFLKGLRELCDTYGALLIFDEVITGFRIEYGGMQTRVNITPDLTTLGKIIGGGFPVGAYGGKREYMEQVAPAGPIYQAGTLSGNPVAMVAGINTLKILKSADYASLEKKVENLCQGIEEICKEKGIHAVVNRIASMFSIFFTDRKIRNYSDVTHCDTKKYSQFFAGMRENKIFIAPSPFEVSMASFAHTDEHFNAYLEAARKSL